MEVVQPFFTENPAIILNNNGRNTTPMNVLFISPHTDDVEIGASSLAISYVNNSDVSVRHIALSPCKKSIPEGFKSTATSDEFVEAQDLLGIDDHLLYDLEVRTFPNKRQKILDILIKELNDFEPDMVISTSYDDIHQDHAQVGKEVMRAFRQSTILFYTSLSNCYRFKPNYFLRYDNNTWDKRETVLRAYRSQMCKKPMVEMIRAYHTNISILKLGEVGFVEPFRVEKMIPTAVF